MEIETKFNIGDIVYMWTGCEIKIFKITSIIIVINIDNEKIQKSYKLEEQYDDIPLDFYECEELLLKKAFKTIKECKENIINKIKNS